MSGPGLSGSFPAGSAPTPGPMDGLANGIGAHSTILGLRQRRSQR